MWPTFVSRCRKKVRRPEMPRKRRQESLSSRRGGATLEHSETTTMFVNLPCTTPIRQNTQQLSTDKIYVIRRLKRYKHTEFYFVSNNCALLFWHETWDLFSAFNKNCLLDLPHKQLQSSFCGLRRSVNNDRIVGDRVDKSTGDNFGQF